MYQVQARARSRVCNLLVLSRSAFPIVPRDADGDSSFLYQASRAIRVIRNTLVVYAQQSKAGENGQML